MKNPMSTPRCPFRAFGRDEAGSVVAETVIVLPLFIWAYVALFVYWDSFRSLNTVQKAAYTISDMLSREQTAKTTDYINGMSRVLDFLIDKNQDAKLRVTEVTFSGANNRYEVHWSRSPGNAMTPLTTADLQTMTNQIPKMSPSDFAEIVEVQVDYRPSLDIGMPDQTFNLFIVTSPRFASCITMDDPTGGCTMP